MAPDAPHRDRPLRADPLSGSTDLLDRHPDDEGVDPDGTASVEAARAAARRPSAELPALSRSANLADWFRSKGRRDKGAASSPPPMAAGSSTGPAPAVPSRPGDRSAAGPEASPAAAAATGLAGRLRARVADAPVRQLAEGLALCLVGVGLLLGWVVHISWTPLVDVGLLVIGAVLVLQARRSTPARPLIALGVLLALVSVATWRADVTLDGGIGRHREAPAVSLTGPYRYQLGTGQLTVDLRSTAFTTAPLKVDAEVGVGRIVVRVPKDAVVATRAVAGGGQVVVFGKRHAGAGVDEPFLSSAAGSKKQIVLDLRVGLGSVEVKRG